MEGINALMRHERVERDSRHRRPRHGEGRVFERQAGIRRGSGQRAGAGGHLGRPGRRRSPRSSRESPSTTAPSVRASRRMVAEYTLRDRILALLKQHKAYLCNDQQKEALGKLLITPNWTVNPQCVGQAPTKIAQDGGLRSSGRYVHHLLRDRRRRQEVSALGRETFAGALADLRAPISTPRWIPASAC